MEVKNPAVFISYSHESKEHQDRVLNFSNKLRSEGIDCSLDQYEESPPEGWPKWMDKKVMESNFILIVCTETYYKRVMGDDVKGLGIKWESTLIYQQLYNAGNENTRFIPVIFNDGKFEYIPNPLQGATFYNVDNSDEYDKLYWRLRGVKTQKPELGKLRNRPEDGELGELPIKERKTLFLSSLIDQEKWNKAKWRNGVAYLYDSQGELPPMFTVLFDNIELGTEIFKELIAKVGEDDKNERIRLSIVEGDVPNQEYGYFVTIGENAEATNKLLKNSPLNDNIRYLALGQRIHRMKPDKNSDSLSIFKKEYKKHGCYYIVPAKQLYDPKKGYGFQVETDYKILKREIGFRNYTDISSKNDPDSTLKSQNLLNHKF